MRPGTNSFSANITNRAININVRPLREGESISGGQLFEHRQTYSNSKALKSATHWLHILQPCINDTRLFKRLSDEMYNIGVVSRITVTIDERNAQQLIAFMILLDIKRVALFFSSINMRFMSLRAAQSLSDNFIPFVFKLEHSFGIYFDFPLSKQFFPGVVRRSIVSVIEEYYHKGNDLKCSIYVYKQVEGASMQNELILQIRTRKGSIVSFDTLNISLLFELKKHIRIFDCNHEDRYLCRIFDSLPPIQRCVHLRIDNVEILHLLARLSHSFALLTARRNTFLLPAMVYSPKSCIKQLLTDFQFTIFVLKVVATFHYRAGKDLGLHGKIMSRGEKPQMESFTQYLLHTGMLIKVTNRRILGVNLSLL